jgi:epoxyqueuosine reductase
MGNRIYGCDDCLAVCPWNKFAQAASEAKLVARDDLKDPRLADLLGLDDAGFRALFQGSPIKRVGRDRFIRNCLIAAGNSADQRLVPVCNALLLDPSPLVRGAAVWALGRLVDQARFVEMATHASDLDETVMSEWRSAVATIGYEVVSA